MSAAAVLEAAYSSLAREADATDANRRMFATEPIDETDTARYRLDDHLGLIADDDEPAVTNVVELAAWVARVNATMT
jgi:hypothetical protein